MSPRAAWRLERLGFSSVYDYVAGKLDWMAAGLPTVRADATSERRALDVADREPPTCAPTTPIGELPSGRSVIVVNDGGIVLGRVSASRNGDPRRPAEDITVSYTHLTLPTIYSV